MQVISFVRSNLVELATVVAVAGIAPAGVRVTLLLGLLLVAVAVASRRLRRSAAAAVLVLAGVLVLGGGLIGRHPLLVGSGAVYVAVGVTRAWGVNRGRRRLRAWGYRALTAFGALVATLLVVYPSLLTIDYLAKPRDGVDDAALRLPHRDVEFEASDGVRLSGWLAPGSNGAAIVLVHGGGGDREGTIRHARMLHRAGYSFLLYEARGRGRSAGHENAFGWNWDRDVRGAVDYLRARGTHRIGLLGLSTGAEAVVAEAATDPRVGAVVADGLQGRTAADATHLSLSDRITLEPAFAVVGWEISAVRGEHAPHPLIRDVHRVAATRPLLLVGTETFERTLDRAYVRGTAAHLWELPGTAHTKGLADHPAEYRQRVLAVFAAGLDQRPAAATPRVHSQKPIRNDLIGFGPVLHPPHSGHRQVLHRVRPPRP